MTSYLFRTILLYYKSIKVITKQILKYSPDVLIVKNKKKCLKYTFCVYNFRKSTGKTLKSVKYEFIHNLINLKLKIEQK